MRCTNCNELIGAIHYGKGMREPFCDDCAASAWIMDYWLERACESSEPQGKGE